MTILTAGNAAMTAAGLADRVAEFNHRGVKLAREAIGLAVSLELPLLVIDIQRGGPSTGLPTKTEQADLLQAMFGRNGEAPVPIVAPRSPGDCFDAAVEAVRIATTYRTPVFLLSDGYVANGSEPWLIPDPSTLPPIEINYRTEREGFFPYLRDPATLARPWVQPGTPGLEHRIGGLEKADVTGNVSYDPDNHDLMTRLRAQKVAGIAGDIPDILRNKRVITLDLALMVAGTKYRGEFEERLKAVLKEINDSDGQIITFIDELHTLMGAGGGEGSVAAANMLKPMLARGELRLIGATTLNEYREFLSFYPTNRRAAAERGRWPLTPAELLAMGVDAVCTDRLDRIPADFSDRS